MPGGLEHVGVQPGGCEQVPVCHHFSHGACPPVVAVPVPTKADSAEPEAPNTGPAVALDAGPAMVPLGSSTWERRAGCSPGVGAAKAIPWLLLGGPGRAPGMSLPWLEKPEGLCCGTAMQPLHRAPALLLLLPCLLRGPNCRWPQINFLAGICYDVPPGGHEFP